MLIDATASGQVINKVITIKLIWIPNDNYDIDVGSSTIRTEDWYLWSLTILYIPDFPLLAWHHNHTGKETFTTCAYGIVQHGTVPYTVLNHTPNSAVKVLPYTVTCLSIGVVGTLLGLVLLLKCTLD